MEKQEISWKACSACTGDYEDPDFTAWGHDDEEPKEVIDGCLDDGSPAAPEER